jgi:hypothetical protein
MHGNLKESGHLSRGGKEFAEVAAIGKQTLRMRLLEVVCADFTAWNLSCDRKDGRPTAVSIIQSVDQVEISGSTTTRADGQLPGDLRLSRSGERADLFMADLNPGNALMTAQGIDKAIQRISGHAIDSFYSHLDKCFDHHFGYGWHLFPLPIDLCINNAIQCLSGGKMYGPTEGQCRFT